MYKFPVPRLAAAIVDEWADELAVRIDCQAAAIRKNTERIPFPHDTVRVDLMDKSVVEFRFALFVVSESKRAVAVFTEHCGHHVFPHHEAKVYVDGQLKYEQNPHS